MSSMDATVASCLLLILATTTASSICAQQASVGGCLKNERDALLSIRDQVRSDPQSILASWNGQDCCLWSGVRCSNTTGHVIKLDLRNNFFWDDLSVLGATYSPHGMRGKISSSLLALHHLEYLDLSGNYLGGVGVPIPLFLGFLASLIYLNLSFTDFEGKVPSQLGNLSRLIYLDLDNRWNLNEGNQLHVDDISWLSRLPLLRFLDMSGVDLSTNGNLVQEINMLPNLRALRLRQCNIVFPYTPIENSNLTSLEMLDLSESGVHTLNPTYWFWDVRTIRHLDLTNNGFAGAFPDAMGNMTSLEVLKLGGNYLTGVKSELLKNLCNLRVLTLYYSQINQDMSEFLKGLPQCVWSKMELLDLSCTNPGGEIPKWINQWTGLSILQLSSNRLVGSIPIEIGMLSMLSKLYLDSNQLNGSISEEHLSSLVNLVELDLSYNSLHMMISSKWIPPFKLQVAYFPSINLGLRFPLWLNGQTDITNLDISDAGIVDHLPDWFWTILSNVQYLNISCNQISGRLPRTLEFMSSSRGMIFDLSSNKLTGSLPQLPRHLVELDISRNLLSGPLPRNFGAPFLADLLVSENIINGTIPVHICELRLNVLDLAKNSLVGQFPLCSEVSGGTQKLSTTISAIILYENDLSGDLSFLQSCPELVLLDLAYNKFIGELPTWIAKRVPNLSYLRLRHNMFSGSIPVQLTQLSYLQYLDLAYNRISGSIPHTLANLKAMTQDNKQALENPLTWSYERPANPDTGNTQKYDDRVSVVMKGQYLNYTSGIIYMVGLDLSCNNLVGDIPDEITALVRLKNLNISYNRLSGKIPEKIGFLGSLESLDMSCNELSGEIPSSFSDMTMLSTLNLSYNDLSGRVPMGDQLQALTDPASSYIGNEYLCGPPLSRSCSGHEAMTGGDPGEHEAETRYFYLGLAAGFVMGLWVVFVVFLFGKKWRVSYFQQFDTLLHAIQKSEA